MSGFSGFLANYFGIEARKAAPLTPRIQFDKSELHAISRAVDDLASVVDGTWTLRDGPPDKTNDVVTIFDAVSKQGIALSKGVQRQNTGDQIYYAVSQNAARIVGDDFVPGLGKTHFDLGSALASLPQMAQAVLEQAASMPHERGMALAKD